MAIRTINKYLMIIQIAKQIMDLITNIITNWEEEEMKNEKK